MDLLTEHLDLEPDSGCPGLLVDMGGYYLCSECGDEIDEIEEGE